MTKVPEQEDYFRGIATKFLDNYWLGWEDTYDDDGKNALDRLIEMLEDVYLVGRIVG